VFSARTGQSPTKDMEKRFRMKRSPTWCSTYRRLAATTLTGLTLREIEHKYLPDRW
jgi:hypothetical protein